MRHILRLGLVLALGVAFWQQGGTLLPVSWLAARPASAAAALPPAPGLRLNEFMPRPDSDWNGNGTSNPLDSYIEIQNTASIPILLTGFALDDEQGDSSSNPYPLSGTLQPGEIRVYFRSETSIVLSQNEDEVRLLDPEGDVVDAHDYEDADADQAWSRDAQGDWHDDLAPTPGQPNQPLPPPTRTRTVTATPTSSATPLPSVTASPTRTVTPLPSATGTTGPSPTRTVSPLPSATGTTAPSPTRTVPPLPSATGTTAPSPTQTVSATPQQPPVTPSASPSVPTPPASTTPAPPAVGRLYLPLVLYPGQPVVVNGTFGSGTLDGWTTGATSTAFAVRAVQMEGDWAAQLGNPNAACHGGSLAAGAAWLYQTIRVPDQPTPTLSFRYRLISQDDQRFERLRMIVRDAAGNVLQEVLVVGAPQPATLCDAPPRDLGWRTATTSLAAFRGQSVQLYFELRSSDDTPYFNTWGYVDDVTVVGSN